tara:strand:- start:1376 stop:1903 length:528 start_codon:yes stop_codon:yes gene_type:complete
MEPSNFALVYRFPILATVGYVALFFRFIGNQKSIFYSLQLEKLMENKEEFDRYHSNDGRLLAADRTLGNLLEQAPAFLASLWICALSSEDNNRIAGILGIAWVLIRALYPIILGNSLRNFVPTRIYFVTLPAYTIILFMTSRALVAAFPALVLRDTCILPFIGLMFLFLGPGLPT